jgi:4,5-DOPA dioxygenase extradiol
MKEVSHTAHMNEIRSTAAFRSFNTTLPDLPYTMPVLFIGHGSPMNGIENNTFSNRWSTLAQEIPTPTAVLVISAHWFTRGTMITAMDFPKTIHDFGGFPDALYQIQYPASGSPILAKETVAQISSTEVFLNHDWGLDHGTWSIVRHMYPKANIPVLQLSMDYTKNAMFHYELGKELLHLRKKGVLIIGSGNMVHNLRMVSWDKVNGPAFGFDWAIEINQVLKDRILQHNHASLIEYEKLGREAMLAIPTPEHYLPLLYALGLQGKEEGVSFFNDLPVGGSLTMTSVKIG